MAPKKDSKPTPPKAKAKAKKVEVKKVTKKDNKSSVEKTEFKAKYVGAKLFITIGSEVLTKSVTKEEKEKFNIQIEKIKEKPTTANLEALKKMMKPVAEAAKVEKVKETATIKKEIKKISSKKDADDKKELAEDIKSKLEKGTATDAEINEIQALINKNKKIEQKAPEPAPARSPYRGER